MDNNKQTITFCNSMILDDLFVKQKKKKTKQTNIVSIPNQTVIVGNGLFETYPNITLHRTELDFL